MSLLGQVLALGGVGSGDGEDRPLTAAQARDVLGLAGQEVMDRLLGVLAAHDAGGVASLVRELLLQGVDMGFFLRELGGLWRNLFLLRQAGAAAAADLSLPEAEVRRLTEMAGHFSLTYIHAAWQMTLDGQRRILTSLEPAAGLELLLLNLALLPRLLPLAELNPAGTPPAESNGGPTPVAPSSPVASEDGAALSFPSVGSASSGVGGPSARRAEEATPRPALCSARPGVKLPGGPAPPAQPASGGGTDEVPAYLLDDEVPLPEPDGPAAGDAVVAYLADIPAAGASGDGGPVAPGGRRPPLFPVALAPRRAAPPKVRPRVCPRLRPRGGRPRGSAVPAGNGGGRCGKGAA